MPRSFENHGDADRRSDRTSARTALESRREPGLSSGSAATPQARKLGLKPGQRVAFDRAPSGWSLADPPPGLEPVADGAPADLIVAFFNAAAELPARLPTLVARIFPDGALWLAWPRRAAGHTSDITDTLLRAQALPLGVVDVKVAAIDDDWSGLRFVWRRSSRQRSERATG